MKQNSQLSPLTVFWFAISCILVCNTPVTFLWYKAEAEAYSLKRSKYKWAFSPWDQARANLKENFQMHGVQTAYTSQSRSCTESTFFDFRQTGVCNYTVRSQIQVTAVC